MRAGIWLAVCAILLSVPAGAATRSVSRSVWVIARDQVTVRVVIPAAEASYTVAPGLPPPSNEKVAAYVLQHLGVETAGSACEAIDQGYDIGRINTLAAGPGLYGYEIIFHCPSAGRPTLKNAMLFERMPQHVDYARIDLEGASITQLFTAQRQQLDLAVNAKSTGAGAYASLGASHVAHSLQRVGFLLGLLLLARGGRDWLTAAAGLLLGYVCSAAILAMHLVPQAPSIESALGLLVALCAVQWMAMRVQQVWRLALILTATLGLLSVAVWRVNGAMAWVLLGSAVFSGSFCIFAARRLDLFLWVLPLLFGVLDGVVLWGDYSRLHLWRELGSSTLMFFNAGSLLMELGIMALLYAATVAWARIRGSTAFNSVAADAAATALAGMGAFWLLIQLKG